MKLSLPTMIFVNVISQVDRVLRKALLGIKNRQPFDECFLMAVATVGAFALGDYLYRL